MMVRWFLKTVLITVLYNVSVNSESMFSESENAQCGNIFTEKQFILTSENYPSPYPPDKECFYLLRGQNCTIQFNIEFQDFDIKSSVGCTKDRLEIGHQDALCGKTNGSKVYIAEKGSLKLKFISNNDLEKNNRGFRALITRIDACKPDNSSFQGNITFESRDIFGTSTELTQVEWASKETPLKPNYLPPVTRQCCQNNIYGSKRFLLVSPNFPYSSNTPADCVYVIKKASSQVCRLRINLLFFSMGPPTQTSCPNGYLEIEGKYICGCNADLQLTTHFGDLDSKVFKYHNSGYSTNEFFGFVLEVIQDECPKRYSPDDGVPTERSLSNNFRFYNDQYNKVSWPQDRNIDQLKLVNERIHWLPPDNYLHRKSNNIYKHFYFFAPQGEEDRSWTQSSQEKEETNNIDISTINTLLTSFYNYRQCVQWNRSQMILLNRRFGSNLYQMCKSFEQNNNDDSSCQILRSVNGHIRSPGFPVVYPARLNICYRFQLLAGYCAVQIFFNDFQIEESYDCLKDYLAINQYRYCGSYLTNKQLTINIKGKSRQDINFVTDANYCGKGFSAVYQQVPCQKTDDPITPINCNPNGETTEIPLNCNEIIRERFFVITNEAGTDFCSFNIKKFSEDVCRIKLYFERFNLPCDSESITIDGRVYCGQMSGQSLTIDILDEKTILYRRNRLYFKDYSGDFLIRGTQISDGCEANTPEPVRLTLSSSKINGIFSTGELDKPVYPAYYQDVCNLIKNNITSEKLPNKICELLTKDTNASDCHVFKAEFLDMPASGKNITKIRLTTSEKAEKVGYQVIECKN